MDSLFGNAQGTFDDQERLGEPPSPERARKIFEDVRRLRDLSNFERALVLASRLHANQTRKGGEIPYLMHLLGVTSLVLMGGGDEQQAIAALLHDSVEDQNAEASDIEEMFGGRVAEIVTGCTDVSEAHDGPARSAENSMQRKAAYLEKLAAERDSAIRLVSVADKLHNARSILDDYRRAGDEVWERFNVPREGTLDYYRSLARIFGQPPIVPLIEEFRRTVEDLLNETASSR